MDKSSKILSDIIVHSKYAKFDKVKGRRETWEEICDRNVAMHVKKYPQLKVEIQDVYDKYVKTKKVLPSMRSCQFAGRPIEINPTRIFNCSALPIEHPNAFSEVMFLLLSGTGVGFSIQNAHVKKLPEIKKPVKTRRYVVGDSIEGWADSIKMLCKAYFEGKSLPVFDYSDIREKGMPLITSGGKAPGPQPLKDCHHNLMKILDSVVPGEQLTSLQCYDMVCFIADAVLSGGIRRSATIALFDMDDEAMLSCKSGAWWELNPQRGRSNNSAVVLRSRITKPEFMALWAKIEASGAGEPGIFLTNDPAMLTNPCVTGDTLVLTDQGYKPIIDLVGEKVNVWNGEEWSEVTPKVTGENQRILEVSFSDGSILKCTPYHKFYVTKGYNGETSIKEAQELVLGDHLIKWDAPIIRKGIEDNLQDMYTRGLYAADGTKNTKVISLYNEKIDLVPYLSGLAREQTHSTATGSVKKYFKVTCELYPKNWLPHTYGLQERLAWLAGLFDGDGCELKEGGIQLVSVDTEFLHSLQLLLQTCGVKSKVLESSSEHMKNMPDGKGGSKEYLCQASKRICIGAVAVQQLKSLGMDCKRLTLNKEPQRDASRFVQVVGIKEQEDLEDFVYCFNEPKKHKGVFNGILTGQCCEISLRPYQFCNLVEVNLDSVESEVDFIDRCKAATMIATLQASYTDFHYLNPQWKKTTEREALIGVGLTGIASNKYKALDLSKGADVVKQENVKWAKVLGINPAARTTCVKPAGTTSIVLGCSSGIHAWHSEYYIRRVRYGKNEAIAKYLIKNHPELVQDEYFRPKEQIVLELPQKAPKGATTRDTEITEEMLSRIAYFSEAWVKAGHVAGPNYNNVSATVSIRDYEWEMVGNWMWENRSLYTGLSVLPYDGGSYVQAPFEECSKKEYERRVELLKDFDITKVVESEDNTELTGEAACAGGICEIR